MKFLSILAFFPLLVTGNLRAGSDSSTTQQNLYASIMGAAFSDCSSSSGMGNAMLIHNTGDNSVDVFLAWQGLSGVDDVFMGTDNDPRLYDMNGKRNTPLTITAMNLDANDARFLERGLMKFWFNTNKCGGGGEGEMSGPIVRVYSG